MTRDAPFVILSNMLCFTLFFLFLDLGLLKRFSKTNAHFCLELVKTFSPALTSSVWFQLFMPVPFSGQATAMQYVESLQRINVLTKWSYLFSMAETIPGLSYLSSTPLTGL